MAAIKIPSLQLAYEALITQAKKDILRIVAETPEQEIDLGGTTMQGAFDAWGNYEWSHIRKISRSPDGKSLELLTPEGTLYADHELGDAGVGPSVLKLRDWLVTIDEALP